MTQVHNFHHITDNNEMDSEPFLIVWPRLRSGFSDFGQKEVVTIATTGHEGSAEDAWPSRMGWALMSYAMQLKIAGLLSAVTEGRRGCCRKCYGEERTSRRPLEIMN